MPALAPGRNDRLPPIAGAGDTVGPQGVPDSSLARHTWALITPVDAPQLMLEACPSFAAKWPEVGADNADGAERLLYLDAGDFIRHVVELHQQNQTTEFDGIFSAIERMVTEGDEYVSNLGVIGYLEGLQMASVTSAGIDPEVEFRPRLGALVGSDQPVLGR